MPAITDIRERTVFLEKSTRYVFSLDLWLAFECPTDYTGWDGRLRARGATRDQIRAALAKKASPASANRKANGATIHIHIHPDDDDSDSYHVVDEELTTTVDGGVHEMPLVQVNDLQDWITVEPGGLLNLAGRCRLRSEDDARISMRYSGVVRLGFAGERSLCEPAGKPTGNAQIAAQFESDRPRYRWLTQAQFIGFGTAAVNVVAPAQGTNQPRNPRTGSEPPAMGSVQASWTSPDANPVVKTLALSIDFYSAI